MITITPQLRNDSDSVQGCRGGVDLKIRMHAILVVSQLVGNHTKIQEKEEKKRRKREENKKERRGEEDGCFDPHGPCKRKGQVSDWVREKRKL